MASAIVWLVCTVLMFIEFGVVACSAVGCRRRSRFYLRLGSASLLMLALALGFVFALKFTALPERVFGLAWVGLLLAALGVAPVFCYHASAPFRDSSDGDGGGGPGSGPPPPSPMPPGGGTPLPDADQSRTRRRDHNRPSPRGVIERRPAREPVGPGVPSGPGRR
jgi:hypothetical protein